jgi:hypothetical protein
MSCVDHNTNSADREQLIAEGVRIKTEEFRQNEWTKCVVQARTLAVAEVDSMIRAMAKQDAVEPILKPPKPDRPEKPELKSLPDSLLNKTRKDTVD